MSNANEAQNPPSTDDPFGFAAWVASKTDMNRCPYCGANLAVPLFAQFCCQNQKRDGGVPSSAS
ncbi:hypothetical protein WS67_12245 [Burkholderia singularis]|uniref:Uncharacterized protein n=1 Tax=Burkholderia singularis TaxID=1503053 RepID=A0A124P933_9BURK|nr:MULTISPECIES: hypothetical protein [Burkholderia]KVE27264.1 hypothetical protein WS67_12245 [Burkholderia singularis]KVE33757.1 hypothetical protein WS68_11335 [Burkholderia sp. TSV86]